MSVKTYDPAGIAIIVAGGPIEGFAPDTFVVAARRNPSWALTVGADGEGARAKSNDKSGTITFTLIQTSLSNDFLSSLAALDELTNNGVGPLLIKDLNGDTIIAAGTAWVQKPADSEYGKEIATREWVLETDDLNMFVGGVIA